METRKFLNHRSLQRRGAFWQGFEVCLCTLSKSQGGVRVQPRRLGLSVWQLWESWPSCLPARICKITRPSSEVPGGLFRMKDTLDVWGSRVRQTFEPQLCCLWPTEGELVSGPSFPHPHSVLARITSAGWGPVSHTLNPLVQLLSPC